MCLSSLGCLRDDQQWHRQKMQSSDVLKMMHAARDQTFSSVFAYKSRNRPQIKSVARITNFVRCHIVTVF